MAKSSNPGTKRTGRSQNASTKKQGEDAATTAVVSTEGSISQGPFSNIDLGISTDIKENEVDRALLQNQTGNNNPPPPIVDKVEPTVSNTPPAPVVKQPEKAVSAFDILSDVTGPALDEPISDIPRKIVILRKIERSSFRLGLEKAEDRPLLVPGTGHTFTPYMRGRRYLNSWDKPEFAGLRPIIEQGLGISLADDSSYYQDLTFKMLDRKDGHFISLDGTPGGMKNIIIYSCMMASPIIANGLQEYTSGAKPFAEWYVENREAEAEAKEKQIDLEIRANAEFVNLSDSRRIKIAKILNLKVWGLSPSVVKTTLWEFIKKGDPKTQTTPALALKLFMDALGYGDTKIEVFALVKDAIEFNILRQDKSREYFYGDTALGMTAEEITARLMNAKYNNIRLSIEQRVNVKLGEL